MTIGGFIKRTKEKEAKPKPFGRRLGAKSYLFTAELLRTFNMLLPW